MQLMLVMRGSEAELLGGTEANNTIFSRTCDEGKELHR